MSAPLLAPTLAAAFRCHADHLAGVAAQLEHLGPDGPLPPHRFLVIAGGALATLDDLERELHRLEAWLPHSNQERAA